MKNFYFNSSQNLFQLKEVKIEILLTRLWRIWIILTIIKGKKVIDLFPQGLVKIQSHFFNFLKFKYQFIC